jgi:hypothetical protein
MAGGNKGNIIKKRLLNIRRTSGVSPQMLNAGGPRVSICDHHLKGKGSARCSAVTFYPFSKQDFMRNEAT